MPTRRALLALPAFLSPQAARADQAARNPPALPLPRPVRLQPGAAPLMLHATVDDRGLELHFAGTGAPSARFRFPSWYGYARVFAIRRLRGRDIVFACFEGNTGTGVYQEIQAAIGQEDDGTMRILALETLHSRSNGPCDSGIWLTIRAEPRADGSALQLDQVWRRQGSSCPPRPGGPARSRLAWSTPLAWSGRGPMHAPPWPECHMPAPWSRHRGPRSWPGSGRRPALR